MTDKKEDLNPSKRTQIIEEPLESETDRYQKLYEAQYKETIYWHTKELDMERKRNEWRLIFIITVIISVILAIILGK